MNAPQFLGKRFTRSRPRLRRARPPVGTRHTRFERLEDRLLLDGVPFLFPELSIQVNPNVLLTNHEPEVDIAPNGDFTVAWQSGGEADIYSRAYRATMSPKQAEPANLTAEAAYYASNPDLATNDSGESVVIWHGPIDYASDHHAMFFQQVAANGTPELPSPVGVYDDQALFRDGKVANASGEFVVAYIQDNDVRVRKFRADGTSVWLSLIYMVPDAQMLPPWGTTNTAQIGVWHLDVICSTSLVGPLEGLKTAVANESPTLLPIVMDSAPGGVDAVDRDWSDSIRPPGRHDLNDEALLAVIDEWNEIPVDVFDNFNTDYDRDYPAL